MNYALYVYHTIVHDNFDFDKLTGLQLFCFVAKMSNMKMSLLLSISILSLYNQLKYTLVPRLNFLLNSN